MHPTNKLPYFERLSVFACLACFCLMVYRCLFSLSFNYTYLLWNLAVAIIPYLISKKLSINTKPASLPVLRLVVWFLFFPCCIFLLADLLQIRRHENFPFAYDLLLLFSFAIAGIIPGLMSLKKVENFLGNYFPTFIARLFIMLAIFLSSYSIALIRFMHLKSWDISDNIKKLVHLSYLSPDIPSNLWLHRITTVACLIILYSIFNKFYPSLKNRM